MLFFLIFIPPPPPTLCHEHAVHGALLAQYKWSVIIIIIIIIITISILHCMKEFCHQKQNGEYERECTLTDRMNDNLVAVGYHERNGMQRWLS